MPKNNPIQNSLFIMTILDLLPAQIFWKDKDLIYRGCNQAFAHSVGLNNKDEIIGRSDFDLPVDRVDSAKYRQDDLVIMTAKTSKLNFEEEQLLADGTKKILSTSKVPIMNASGESEGVLGIYIDITERKMLENELNKAKDAAEAANQTKTEFLENMRHDIRTPLAGIVGFAELLKLESKDQLFKDYAENLVVSSHALLNILDEVLESIHVSSGEIPLLKRKFDLYDTLTQVLNLNRARAAQKRLKIKLTIDQKVPQYIVGDKIRLHRIVLELVTNALNFTDRGEVNLQLFCEQNETQKPVLKIIVKDTGIGMPNEKQQEIYLQFRRLSPSYKGIYKGAGLGLFIVKRFIEELQGEIYVESEIGKGTQFTCLIPIQPALIADASGVDNTDEVGEPVTVLNFAKHREAEFSKNKSIYSALVVEDNLIARLSAQALLQKCGCEVDIAENGKDAIEAYKHQHYDLILMDIGLPDIDGCEVAKTMRKLSTQTSKQPIIIALTSHVGEAQKSQYMASGMNAVYTKPLSLERCNEIIHRYL